MGDMLQQCLFVPYSLLYLLFIILNIVIFIRYIIIIIILVHQKYYVDYIHLKKSISLKTASSMLKRLLISILFYLDFFNNLEDNDKTRNDAVVKANSNKPNYQLHFWNKSFKLKWNTWKYKYASEFLIFFYHFHTCKDRL